jgi:hypothetical protein
LIAPNGGEIWIKNSDPKIIQWDRKINSEVNISLFRNGQFFRTVIDTVESEFDSYHWIIPSDVPEDSLYQIKVTSLKNPEIYSLSRKSFSIKNITNIIENKEDNKFSLINYPNPFSNFSYFELTIEKPINCSIEIFDINGIMIKELLNSRLNLGKYTFIWDASEYPSGIYYYLIKINGDIRRGTLTLIK